MLVATKLWQYNSKIILRSYNSQQENGPMMSTKSSCCCYLQHPVPFVPSNQVLNKLSVQKIWLLSSQPVETPCAAVPWMLHRIACWFLAVVVAAVVDLPLLWQGKMKCLAANSISLLFCYSGQFLAFTPTVQRFSSVMTGIIAGKKALEHWKAAADPREAVIAGVGRKKSLLDWAKTHPISVGRSTLCT